MATIEEAVAQAKRAFALRKFEQAVDHYATALEIMYVPLKRPDTPLRAMLMFVKRRLRPAGRMKRETMLQRLLTFIFRTERLS